jgi:hypothetical protein
MALKESLASPEANAGKFGTPHQESPSRRYIVLLAVFLLGFVIWLIPPPSGVQPPAWHLLAIFVTTIVGSSRKHYQWAR